MSKTIDVNRSTRYMTTHLVDFSQLCDYNVYYEVHEIYFMATIESSTKSFPSGNDRTEDLSRGRA